MRAPITSGLRTYIEITWEVRCTFSESLAPTKIMIPAESELPYRAGREFEETIYRYQSSKYNHPSGKLNQNK